MSAAEKPDPVPYILDRQVGYLLRLASQRHAAIFQARMTEGLTPTQFAVLIRLEEAGPSSQNHLGRLAHLDVATVKGVVDRLAAKGLVTFSTDEADNRRRVVTLSPKSLALMPRLHALGHRITEDTLAPLDGEEREALVALLRKLA
jgi:DNA-binding MarR family transcriptional regulator